VVEIYGPESSGKTTLTLQAIAQCQKLGGTAAFVDAEHALDPTYAQKLGVNVDDLLVSQPDTGEAHFGWLRRWHGQLRERCVPLPRRTVAVRPGAHPAAR